MSENKPRLRRLARRYLAAELSGTAAALTATWAAHRLGATPYAAGLCGSIGETVAYYTAILAGEWIRDSPRAVLRSLPGMVLEFGPAEVLDTLLTRPLLMAAGPAVTGDLAGGTLAGKVAADLIFYSVVVPSGWLRRRSG